MKHLNFIVAVGSVLGLTSGFTPTTSAAPHDPAALAILRQDAELADVCFADSQHGWAVGDRGVIWHTRDGGASWRQQASPVTCRLNSVCFLDAERGWAAGGARTPFTHVPEGVVLATRDGGKTWTVQSQRMLPTFQRIKFFDAQQGVAFGAPSALFPSGVFTTEDGGRAWTTMPSENGQTWLAGDFVDPLTGALAGSGGQPAIVRRRMLTDAQTPPLGLRTLRAMQLVAPNGGWLVGDGGLVMTTSDLGKTWQTTAGELPDRAGEIFDLTTLALQGETVWVAGAPGTRVFRSTDGGRTWTAHATGVQAPLLSLHFVDARHGWAVGGFGQILSTTDGGQTWRPQRAGGSRAALLGFFSEPEQMPLELFAQLAAGQGYLSVVEVLGRRDLDPQAGVRDDLLPRAHDALVAVGGNRVENAWRFPLRQAGLGQSIEQIVAGLDRANDGRALEKLEAHVVQSIRTYRPEIIVTHHASVRGDHPLEHLVNQIVLRAVDQAADPTRYVELATTAGLEPWQARKVFSTVPWGESGTLAINTVNLDSRLGRSVGDLAGEARGLVAVRFDPPPVEVGFRLLLDRVPQQVGRDDFFSGIPLAPGGDARRMLSEPLGETLDQLRRVAQKRRNMQELIRRGEEEDARIDPIWQGQLGDLTSGLDESGASQLLHQLAAHYLKQGQWELAAATYRALIEQHPEHPLAHAAKVWLLQYHASGEAAWRLRKQSTFTTQRTVGGPPSAEVTPASANLPMAAQRGLVDEGAQASERWGYAAELGKQLEREAPTLFAEPSVGFPLASARRKQGFTAEAGRFYLGLRRSRPQDAWWSAAQGERWLEQRSGLPPKSLWTAPQTSARPRLDGRLDDSFWSFARPIELKSLMNDDRAWPAEARMAYDRDFLYLGVECRKAVGAKYDATDLPRPRDADLTPHDRVSLLIDIDRDYATYYQLTIDHRGWTHDACWGDASWNPAWYVAHAATDETWTVEAAIPLAELTGQPPAAGQVWAVGLQRTVPNVGFQSWTQPAGTQVLPEGFGYLGFE